MAPDPVSVALEHAVRRWEAEVETERQLLHRENGLLERGQRYLLASVLCGGLGVIALVLGRACLD